MFSFWFCTWKLCKIHCPLSLSVLLEFVAQVWGWCEWWLGSFQRAVLPMGLPWLLGFPQLLLPADPRVSAISSLQSLCLFSTPASGWVASLGLRVDIPLPIQGLHPMGAVGASGSKTWGNHIASLLWYRSSLAGVGQPGRWCFPRAWTKLCVLPPPSSYFLSVSTWKI